ncbi:universal stress protein UspF [Edaphovirga cremea]|uniref:universal stress protein UspF n=1 Tax=Edaphovirga cremea TaxID=2267246 RepID=UPI000DEEC893|nr:universal stress protein UspF [Edaphovirga cremea]
MYKTILVPVDISEIELTRLVIPYVETLARLEDSHIHFVTVMPSSPYYAAFGLAIAAVPDKQEAKDAANDALSRVITEFKIPVNRTKTHIVTGAPKDQILKLADSIDADLIVIGSHRPSVKTYVLGSNASAIVSYARCPVLVVR